MSTTLESQASPGVVRNTNVGLADNIENYSHLVKDAAEADKAEHEMTARQALKIHKKAVFWSMALSAALIMEGYDVVIVSRERSYLITSMP
jgi:SP family general alpha glucoside:H+ symporter-like MFS transporter